MDYLWHVDRIERVIKERELLYPLDVLFLGATGVGKSSTLNALFGEEVAKVGYGVDPETQLVESYRLHELLRFHDSPGLGDGKEADANHAKKITDWLLKPVGGNFPKDGLIDMVMVVLDGGSRDFGTPYRLLEQIILKSIDPDRVVVAINQADMAMKGRGWDSENKKPDMDLLAFLDEKARSVRDRLHEATGLKIKMPVYYSAMHQYNIDALMGLIVDSMPAKRRNMGY